MRQRAVGGDGHDPALLLQALPSYINTSVPAVCCSAAHNVCSTASSPALLCQKALRDMLTVHVTTIVTHMKGRCAAYDAVNEPFASDGTLKQDIWYNAFGGDYIPYVIRLVHSIDPAALLFINQVRPCRLCRCNNFARHRL